MPFLTQYQSDKHIVPFLATDLLKLLKNMTTRSIKPDVMKGVKSVDNSCCEVNKTSHHLDHTKVYVGYIAEKITKELAANKKVGQLRVLEFRMASKKCLLTTFEKLLQKSPLRYSQVSYLRFLDPRRMSDSAAKGQCIR